MDFTGYTFRNLLDLKNNDFLFSNFSVNEMSYPSRLMISGEGKTLPFVFSGNKIFDNLNNFVWSFNSGEAFDLRLQVDGEIYQYYINSNLISNGYRENFKIEKLIIDTSGKGISFSPNFLSEKISLEVGVGSSFSAGSSLDFTLKNLSNAKIRVLSSSIGKYQGPSEKAAFETNQTGILSGLATLLFSSNDLAEDYNSQSNFSFLLNLNTNVGSFNFPLMTSKVSEVNNSFINYTYPSNAVINHSFNGLTGFNKFTFKREELSTDYFLSLEKRDTNGDILPSSGFLDFEISGFYGGNTGVFITGISFSNSGLYSGIPSVVFSSFSGVESIAVRENNLISYEAGDSFNLLFSGNGTGVSAIARTKKVIIDLFSGDNPSHKFRTITGVEISSAGSGFNGLYNVYMSGSVVDYPYSYVDDIATSLGYSPVLFATSFKVTAGFASGRALLSSGNVGELSGVVMLGAGSGYDNGMQFPSISFKRADSDLFTSKASGLCLLNSSGETVDFSGSWQVLASREFSASESDYSLELKTGVSGLYFGPIVFSETEKDLFLKIKSKNFTSYQPTYLNFQFYETGNIKQDFSIEKNNNYSIELDPDVSEDTLPPMELIIEEEE